MMRPSNNANNFLEKILISRHNNFTLWSILILDYINPTLASLSIIPTIPWSWWMIGCLVVNLDSFIHPFRTDYRVSAYYKELVSSSTLTGEALCKTKKIHQRNCGHALGCTQHISNMSRIYIYYMACRLGIKMLVPTIPGFQCLKRCIQFISTYSHNPISYP